MKKLLFLLFFPLWMVAQSSTGQETPFDYGIKIETGAIQTVTNPVYPATMGTDGTIGRALAKDLPIDISPQPTNYTIPDTKLGSHLKGIDVRLGEIGQPTAGVTNRIYFTGVPTTIGAGTFYTSSAAGKGAVAGVLQTVSNDDNVKNYFGQDVISVAQPSAITAPPGNYSGQLSVMVDNNSAQERFTVEIYKTNNAGTPIASGITGAPVGNLGVTVVAILDSGVLDLVASAVSNVTVSGNLASTLSLATGERLRYHISAQKVGTSGNAFIFSLFYGSDYNSYYDVPVTTTTDGVINKSTVSGLTTTNALDALNTGKQNVLTNPVTGTGTTNRVSKWTSSNTQGNSNITDSGTLVSISTPLTTNGLVYTKPSMFTGSDVNDLSTAGFYSAISNTPTANLPTTGAFYITVESASTGIENYVHQIATSFGYVLLPNTPNRIYSRTKVNSIWGTWREIVYTDNTTFTGTTNITSLNISATPDTNAASTHYFVENANIPGAVQPKTLANVRTELVTSASVIAGLGYTPSNSANSVLITGDQSISGVKSLINTDATTINSGIKLTNNGAGTGKSLEIFNNSTGRGISLNNGNGTGIWGYSTGSGNLFYNENTSTGVGFRSDNSSTGTSIVLNSATGSTGDLFRILKNGVLTSKIDSDGNFQAQKITAVSTATASPATVDTELATLGQVKANRPYKVYTALLNQSGTSAPIATVLENTIGGAVVWTYSAVGSYTGTLTGAFTANKTTALVQNGQYNGVDAISRVLTVDTVRVMTVNSSGTLTDSNGLQNSMFEIRVYN